ncbi:helix-turn-helix protein [Streptomyces sp. Ag109_G2-6]|uniref:helix-turn-helix domain-containing protein n=1 Tax=Streptomyces TaxID=1883 RepID=UPI000D1A38E3|nr:MULTISPECIES: helix-turn-helix transcriptional regulator [Streptomyces]RPF43884.1 helix-turn-helix protein [Streptomyces sp. Ag109_G2-6]
MTTREEQAGERAPGRPESVAEFIGELRALKAVEGLSLRELQRRSGLPRSTIAHALRTDRPGLPPWDRVAGLLRALGVAEAALPQWKAHWTRLRLAREAERPPTGPQEPGGAGEGAGTAGSGSAAGPGAPGSTGGRGEAVGAGGAGGPGRPSAAGGAAGSGWPGGAIGPVGVAGSGVGGGAGGAGAQAAVQPAAPGPGRRPGARWWPWRQRLAAHVATLLLGAGIGAGAVLALGGGAPAGAKAGFPVAEQPCPPPTANPHPSLRAPAAGGAGTAKEPPSWVGRVTSGQEILSGSDVVLPVLSPVTEGDALVVTVMLTGSCPGPVAVTDTQGDTFRIVGDETDTARHRTLVLAAFGAHPLGTADSLHATYPHASKYHIAVDEFRGISAAVGSAEAHGDNGGTAFSTGSIRLDCAAGDLMVGAVGTNTGSAPVFTAEWTPLPMLQLSSYRLTTAYRVVPAAQTCAATGTTTAQWAASAVVFR